MTIKKVDLEKKSLSDAKFALYKENPEVNKDAKPLELYDNEDLEGNKKTEFITNDKGEIKIYGLVHGTYYLKRNRSTKRV